MPDLDRRSLVACVALALVLAAFGARSLLSSSSRGDAATVPLDGSASAPPGRAGERADGPSGREAGDAGAGTVELRQAGGALTVHVAGAVRRPGVYRLRSGARIDQAVRRAGGPTRRADLTAVNLAARVQDGRQVVVPVRAPAGSAPAGTGAPPAKLNLNTATAEQLDELDGIGPATADKILRHREERGGFGNVAELGDVPGIGEKRLAALEQLVTV